MNSYPGDTPALPTASTKDGCKRSTEARRPRLSVAIPAYNRVRFLQELLDSIATQDVDDPADIEVVVSEDASPERPQIRALALHAQARSRWPVRYTEVAHNLGYDGNIRRLVALSAGEFCFFMGNDDVLAAGALRSTLDYLARHEDVGMLLRGYAVFNGRASNVTSTIRYVDRPVLLAAGRDALAMAYRRSGVISGYIIRRDEAFAAATARFDGSLYYQMHLTASVLAKRPMLVVPDVLVLCRDETLPEFGAAPAEQGRFTPGGYTPAARVHMLKGAMAILDAHPDLDRDGTRDLIVRDYARHFYPFVVDQLHLSWRAYLRMCRAMAVTAVGRHPSFYVNCAVAYLLGRRRTDAAILTVRRMLGHTPRF